MSNEVLINASKLSTIFLMLIIAYIMGGMLELWYLPSGPPTWFLALVIPIAFIHLSLQIAVIRRS